MRLTSPFKDSKGEIPISSDIRNTRKALIGSSSLWSGLKDPRIVRVSRAFGGKDRHSKVTTIRGLRDRRVRLSVPTAIQLYDLQARLGLNQPSKAVDWLLNAAQHAIDELPPLEFPAVNFLQFHQHSETSLNARNSSSQQDQNLNHEGLESFMIQDIGINNSQCSLHHDHMPCASSHHWDTSNKNYFSQFGVLSSQVEAAQATAISSNHYMTTGLCDLYGRQSSHFPMGSSPQQIQFYGDIEVTKKSTKKWTP